MRRKAGPLSRRVLDKSGIALITTLLVVALLVACVVEFNRMAVADIEISGHFGDDKKILFLAISGINAAAELLTLDSLYSQNDTLLEEWARSREYFELASLGLEEGKLEGEIFDENGKIDVNSLINDNGQWDQTVKAILERLLRQPRFGLSEEEISTIIHSLKDWMDEDDEISDIYGAEDSFYRERGTICKNRRLDTLEEMLLIRGVTEEIFYGNSKRSGIQTFLTVHGGPEININTAPLPVLMALSQDMSEQLAMQMDSFRRDEANVDQLMSSAWYRRIWPYANPLPENYLTTSSKSFTIRVRATLRESVKEVRAIVSRSEGQTDTIYWQETSS